MQWKMYRPFMRAPMRLLGDDENSISVAKDAKILQMPDWVLDLMFDELDVLDRCSLALSCKYLLLYAQGHEHLDYVIQLPPRIEDLQHFFERQLGRGWIPNDLRYCSDCGKFVSTDPLHWRHVSEKYTREHSGRISELWRVRREDGWLRYWIERWCDHDQPYHGDVNTMALRQEDTTRLLCPSCAIMNPDCDSWRRRRVDLQRVKQRPLTEHRASTAPGFHFPREQSFHFPGEHSYHSTIPWSGPSVTINVTAPAMSGYPNENMYKRYTATTQSHVY